MKRTLITFLAITLTIATFAGKKDKKGEKQGYQFKVVKEKLNL